MHAFLFSLSNLGETLSRYHPRNHPITTTRACVGSIDFLPPLLPLSQRWSCGVVLSIFHFLVSILSRVVVSTALFWLLIDSKRSIVSSLIEQRDCRCYPVTSFVRLRPFSLPLPHRHQYTLHRTRNSCTSARENSPPFRYTPTLRTT